jgi:hypothetical protein
MGKTCIVGNLLLGGRWLDFVPLLVTEHFVPAMAAFRVYRLVAPVAKF